MNINLKKVLTAVLVAVSLHVMAFPESSLPADTAAVALEPHTFDPYFRESLP